MPSAIGSRPLEDMLLTSRHSSYNTRFRLLNGILLSCGHRRSSYIVTPKASEALMTLFFNMDKTLGQLFTDLREETVLPLLSIGCLMLPAGPTLFASPAYLMQLLSLF